MELLREMDELIRSGAGDYENRAEFIEEAVRERVLVLKYGLYTDEQEVDATEPLRDEVPRVRPGTTGEREESASIETAALSAPPPDSHYLEEGIDLPVDEPLFGLHNRDYPSLWALRFLADAARDTPVLLVDFEAAVCEAAWEYGATLSALESATGQKLAGLFPTNRDKKESSENAFWMFAIGEHRVVDDEIRSRGPLYQWRVARLVHDPHDPAIGVTAAGRQLLDHLQGLTPTTPHDRPYAEHFITHLRSHAPADWWGFERLLAAVLRGAATRGDVIADFRAGPYSWNENQVSTNAAGYVARAREWGLVTPKQQDGKYTLTEFGEELAQRLRGEAA